MPKRLLKKDTDGVQGSESSSIPKDETEAKATGKPAKISRKLVKIEHDPLSTVQIDLPFVRYQVLPGKMIRFMAKRKSDQRMINLCACFPNNLFGQLGWSFAVCTPLSSSTRNLGQAWRVY